MTLRPQQKKAVAAVLAAFKTQQAALVVCPTGWGKTVMFAALIDAMKRNGRAMVIAHTDELIQQAADKIRIVTGVTTDIEKAEQYADQTWNEWRSPVIVSSVQTQNSENSHGRRMNRFDPLAFGLLVIDEAHRATAATYRRVIDHYGKSANCKILGVTATPDRHDEEALGQIFGDSPAYEYYIADAIKDGWLVPIRQTVVNVAGLDLSSVRVTAGELNGADLSKALEEEEALHGMADPIVQLTGDRKTLVFTASIRQAERMAEILNRHKPDSAQFVTGKTPKDDRKMMFHRYRHNEFQYLVNVGVLLEGYDEPGIQVVAMCRPTKSRARYEQMMGRGTRPLAGVVDKLTDDDSQRQIGFDGEEHMAGLRRKAIAESDKEYLEVIDFCGNHGRHHLVSACDILAGNYSDDIVDRATREAGRDGKPFDVAERLEAARAEIERERAEAARRPQIIVSANFDVFSKNPFDQLGIKPTREPSWHKGRAPSEKQLAFLSRNKIATDGVTFQQASTLIGALIQRYNKGVVTPRQGKVLARAGFDPLMTSTCAKPILDTLFANGFRWPEDQPRPAYNGTTHESRAMAESTPF